MRTRIIKILKALADELQWCQSSAFIVTPQTTTALNTTLRIHAMLIDDVLNEIY